MNRDIADRVVADMREGRRVLVLSDGQPAVRAALEQVATRLDSNEKARRSTGREQCIGAGRIDFKSIRSSVRGLSMDTVVFDRVQPSEQQLTEVMVTICASPRAEVIHA